MEDRSWSEAWPASLGSLAGDRRLLPLSGRFPCTVARRRLFQRVFWIGTDCRFDSPSVPLAKYIRVHDMIRHEATNSTNSTKHPRTAKGYFFGEIFFGHATSIGNSAGRGSCWQLGPPGSPEPRVGGGLRAAAISMLGCSDTMAGNRPRWNPGLDWAKTKRHLVLVYHN